MFIRRISIQVYGLIAATSSLFIFDIIDFRESWVGEMCSRFSKSSLRLLITVHLSQVSSWVPSKGMTVHLTRFKASCESPCVVSLAQIKEDQRLTHSPASFWGLLYVLKYTHSVCLLMVLWHSKDVLWGERRIIKEEWSLNRYQSS